MYTGLREQIFDNWVNNEKERLCEDVRFDDTEWKFVTKY